MNELGTLSEIQLGVVQRCVGHWMERLQVSAEEFARTYNMNPAMLRSIMDGQSNVWTHADAETFKNVVWRTYGGGKERDRRLQVAGSVRSALPRPRTITDVVEEINAELAKG